VEHLHGADLEALVQDGINDLTCVARLNSMGLDHGACAIREHGTRAALAREPHAHLG